MKQGEIYEEMDPSVLRSRIEDLEEENEALGDEVTEWMGTYNDLKEEYDELNLEMIKKNMVVARDAIALIDILHFLQNLADGRFDSIEEEKIDQMCGRIKKYLAGEDW